MARLMAAWWSLRCALIKNEDPRQKSGIFLACVLFLKFGNGGEVYCKEQNTGGHPANGPNQIQERDILAQRENGVDPYKSQQAQKYQCGNCGNNGLAQSAQSAGEYFVDAADKISGTGDDHFFGGETDDCFRIGHQRGKLPGQNGKQNSQRAAQNRGDPDGAGESFFDAADVARAHILRDVGAGGQSGAAADVVEHAVDLIGNGNAGGCILSKAIDRGDDCHIC